MIPTLLNVTKIGARVEEVWKPIASYQGVVGYEISSIMRVRDRLSRIVKEDKDGNVVLYSKRKRKRYDKIIEDTVGVKIKTANIYAKDFLGYKTQLSFSSVSKKPTAEDVLKIVQDSIRTFNKPRSRNGVHGIGKDRYVMCHNSRVVPLMIHGRGNAMKNYVESFVEDKKLKGDP